MIISIYPYEQLCQLVMQKQVVYLNYSACFPALKMLRLFKDEQSIEFYHYVEEHDDTFTFLVHRRQFDDFVMKHNLVFNNTYSYEDGTRIKYGPITIILSNGVDYE